MAITYLPPVVMDGLVLYIDAANTKSYPGSGTTWSDLSGNENNGTLNNGPGFDSANLGSITFDGTDDNVSFGKTAADLGITDTAFSAELVINRDDSPSNNSQGHMGFSSTTISIRNTNRYFVNFRNTSGFESFVDFHSSADSFYLTDTVVLCFTVSNNFVTTYINGSQHTQQNVFANVSSIQSVNYSIAGGYGYFRTQGKIYSNKLYNRVLSSAEVAQNFNAVRTRFGL